MKRPGMRLSIVAQAMQRLIIIVALVSGLSVFAADPPATPPTTNKLGAGVLAPLLDAPRTNARPVTLQPPATTRPKFELHDGDREWKEVQAIVVRCF